MGIQALGFPFFGDPLSILMGREILYPTTSQKQFLRPQMHQNLNKRFYTPPPLGGGDGGGVQNPSSEFNIHWRSWAYWCAHATARPPTSLSSPDNLSRHCLKSLALFCVRFTVYEKLCWAIKSWWGSQAAPPSASEVLVRRERMARQPLRDPSAWSLCRERTGSLQKVGPWENPSAWSSCRELGRQELPWIPGSVNCVIYIYIYIERERERDCLFVCLFVCLCIYIYIYIYICTHTHVQTLTNIYIYIYSISYIVQ